MKHLLKRVKTAYYTWLIHAGDNRVRELQRHAYEALNERQQAIEDVKRLRLRRMQRHLED